MKKLFSIVYISCFLFIAAPLSPIQASTSSPDDSFINSIESDITGDGFKEYIRLEGNLLSEDSTYYHNVWLDITNPFSKVWNIALKGGYEPEIALFDMNHNQILDIFYQVGLNPEKTAYAAQLFSWNEGNIEQVNLPKSSATKGKYMDDYKISFTLKPHKSSKDVSIPDQALATEQRLYDENGNVLKDASPHIERIHQYDPVLISESKGYGLQTFERVKDVTTNDVIGSIETLWYWNKEKWIILQKRWTPSS